MIIKFIQINLHVFHIYEMNISSQTLEFFLNFDIANLKLFS